MQARQNKRKLSESFSSDPPKYSEISSPRHEPPTKDGEKDEELVSAAEALTRLTNSASPPPSFTDDNSETSRIGSPLSSTSLPDLGTQLHPIVQSVNTISRLPLVSNAVRYYETSKRNYATFNYAAGIVEKAAMPVFSKIEVNLNSIHQARLEERARVKKRRKFQGKEDKHEIKKRIKFCLHILKLANENISAKVNDLQDKIKSSEDSPEPAIKEEPLASERPVAAEARPEVEFSSNEVTPSVTNDPEGALETKNEIVATVKKIVHVISNFRPSSLNISDADSGTVDELGRDDAKLKKTIREIILSLPKHVSQSVPCAQKAPNQAITFARESLDMIGRLTTVFNEQLEKAEDWVDGSKEDTGLDASTSTLSEQTSVGSENTRAEVPEPVLEKSSTSSHPTK